MRDFAAITALDLTTGHPTPEAPTAEQQLISQCALVNVVSNALQTHTSPIVPNQSAAASFAALPPPVAPSAVGVNGFSGYTVRYCFANIDNKSSVISLSKLLVREKAAKDGQPRIYLISSSPSQPEMYELAFVSKRHQIGFVDKLKNCMEAHTKNLMNGSVEDVIDDFEEEEDGELCVLHHRAASLLTDSCDAAESGSDDEDEEDSNDDGDHERLSHCSAQSDLVDDCLATSRCDGKRNEFELDIEQDVVIDPDSSEETLYNIGSSSNSNTNNNNERFDNEFQKDSMLSTNEKNSLADNEKLNSLSTTTGSESIVSEENSSSSASSSNSSSGRILKSDCSHGDVVEEGNLTMPATGSNEESGLSERAKDSMDEAVPSKNRLRINRRRRAYRPRNVSNQSSSSSEAAHLQAIALINHQSQNQCLTTSTTTATGLQSKQQEVEGLEEEEFDSGRGHDDSSSAASTSSNSMAGPGGLIKNASLESNTTNENSSSSNVSEHHNKEEQEEVDDASSGSSSSATATSPTAMAKISHTSKTISEPVTGNKSNLVKCHSSLLLGKASCSALINKQQRKLSTVSTMSSQLKLFNKLRSSSKSSFSSSICLHCQQLQYKDGGNHQLAFDEQQQQQHVDHHQSCLLWKQARQQIRRLTFISEQKLEELRDLRIQLDKDKQEWQVKFDRMQEQLLDERRKLDLERDSFMREKQQLANAREQFYRKLDILKENGILLLPSHKVIKTAPGSGHQVVNNLETGSLNRQFVVTNCGSSNQLRPLHNLVLNGAHQPQHHIKHHQHQQQPFYPINTNHNYSSVDIRSENIHSQQRQSKSLFTSQNCHHDKVMHLSESGLTAHPVSTNVTVSSQPKSSSLASSFGLTNKLQPLMQALSPSFMASLSSDSAHRTTKTA